MEALKNLLLDLQTRMNALEQAQPDRPTHRLLAPNMALGDADAAFVAEISRLEREIATLRAERAAWGEQVETYRKAALEIETEWASLAAQWDAVKLTASLLGAAALTMPITGTPAPAPAPAPAPEPEPVATHTTAGTDADADADADADELPMDFSLAVTEQIFSVFTRNVDSTKQWTTREVGLAYAKLLCLGNNASPRLLKQVENTLRRLVQQGRLLKKKSAARGAVVYSLH